MPAEPGTRPPPPDYPVHHLEIEKRLLSTRDWPAVKKALSDLQLSGAILRLRAHQHAVEIAAEAGEVEEVQALMKSWKDQRLAPSYQAFVAAIRLYRDRGMIEAAMEALESFQSATPHWRKGYDAALVTSVINVCSPRDVFRAIKLFHNMLRAGVEPDARAYAGIIYACVRGDRVRKAEEFLREMLARGLEVDNRVYTAVLSRMPLDPSVAETPARILKLLSTMREHGHQPDAILYGAIIRALSVHPAHIVTSLALLNEMQERGIEPSVQICNSLIAGLLLRDPKQAEALYDRMLAGLATPDQRTYALLSEHHAKTGNMSTALEIANTAHQAQHPLSPITFNMLTDIAAKVKDFGALREIKRLVTAAGHDIKRMPLSHVLVAV